MIAARAVVVTVTGLYTWCAPVLPNRLPPAWAVRSVVVASAVVILGVAACAATNAVVRRAHAMVQIDRACSRLGASGSVVAPWTSPPAGFG